MNNDVCGSQDYQLIRFTRDMKEPMKTRVLFYASKIKRQKEVAVLSRPDIDRCIGRAYQDMVDDGEVMFDQLALDTASDAMNAGRVLNIKELLDAPKRRDS